MSGYTPIYPFQCQTRQTRSVTKKLYFITKSLIQFNYRRRIELDRQTINQTQTSSRVKRSNFNIVTEILWLNSHLAIKNKTITIGHWMNAVGGKICREPHLSRKSEFESWHRAPFTGRPLTFLIRLQLGRRVRFRPANAIFLVYNLL